MMRIKRKYQYTIALLLCFSQVAGIDVFAQEPQKEYSEEQANDSAFVQLIIPGKPEMILPEDTLVVDSIAAINEKNLKELNKTTTRSIVVNATDTVPPITEPSKPIWIPNPTRATWLAVVFPGGGQIYNRKYWKLPIFYGGFAGCAYALSWNNNMYSDYSQAYVDIMDGDPTTNSYYDLLPVGVNIDESTDTRYGPILKKRKDYYRRYRDISVFAFIGVYVLSIIDAYVDAELSNFDISPDLSLRIYPTIINNDRSNRFVGRESAFGLQCCFTF